jgi:apolipoprotein N-acyltransferase
MSEMKKIKIFIKNKLWPLSLQDTASWHEPRPALRLTLPCMSTGHKGKLFIALFAGAFCSLAFAPFHLFIAAPFSLTIFYFLLEKNQKQTFSLGFCYGFGFFLAGNYWIAIALLVDAATFFWLIPCAIILIPAALALYFAIFALVYKFLATKFSPLQIYQKILLFALCWLFFEIWRSCLFGGFPWNLLGYVWLFDVHFAQLANIFGIYGLTIFAVLISLLPVLLLQKNDKNSKFFAAILVLFLTGNLCYGYFYIDDKKLAAKGQKEQKQLLLVQANIKQEMKWDPAEKYQNFLKHLELTNSQDLSRVKAVIWSETSVPYAIDTNSVSYDLLQKLQMAVPPQGVLITGGVRISGVRKNNIKVWNSVFVIDKSGIVAVYDKHHLVPFGEYIPLQKYLPFINKITNGAIDFSEGDGPKTFTLQDFSFSPLICYEVIFSNEIINKNSRPDLLVNLTNDGWFGVSSGPYQHLDMAKMRSIEYGIPLVRVANSGISALIDPFGRLIKTAGLNSASVINVDLINNLAPTIYEKHGYMPLILLVALIFLTFIFSVFVPLIFYHKTQTQNPNVTR